MTLVSKYTNELSVNTPINTENDTSFYLWYVIKFNHSLIDTFDDN